MCRNMGKMTVMAKIVDLQKPVIGACEYIALPDLNIHRIKARVDTGARTSALHAVDVEPFEKESKNWVRFLAFSGDTDHTPPVECACPMADRRKVRNTSGKGEWRYVVTTEFVLGSHRWQCEVTLATRDSMRYQMLLGRLAIRGRFLVDTDHVFVQGKPRRA